jgi:hypothetical protein
VELRLHSNYPVTIDSCGSSGHVTSGTTGRCLGAGGGCEAWPLREQHMSMIRDFPLLVFVLSLIVLCSLRTDGWFRSQEVTNPG